MSTQAWIFMVGLRVFDVGGLIIWLIWFSRQRDDDPGDAEWDDRWDLGPGDDEPGPEPPAPGPRGGELPLPAGPAQPWPARRRDHTGDRPPARVTPRRTPAPQRAPAHSPP